MGTLFCSFIVSVLGGNSLTRLPCPLRLGAFPVPSRALHRVSELRAHATYAALALAGWSVRAVDHPIVFALRNCLFLYCLFLIRQRAHLSSALEALLMKSAIQRATPDGR